MLDRRSRVVLLAAAAIVAAAALPVSGCAAISHFAGMGGHAAVRARPANLDTLLERRSDHGLYQVRVEALQKPVVPGRIHSWRVKVEHEGRPVEAAIIAVDGGMPEHGHGYPTKPKVEAAPEGGYLIRGMKFSMRGWWELKLSIQSPAGADQITFNLVV